MKSTRRVLNYTNRVTIDLKHVKVVASVDGNQGYLQVHKLDLSGYEIVDGCQVILEAMTRRDGKIRLELGETPQPALSRTLKIDPVFLSSARIRLKILDATGSEIAISVGKCECSPNESAKRSRRSEIRTCNKKLCLKS